MKLSDAKCPACRAPLQRASAHWEVLACLACGGVWTDAAASQRISTTVDRELVGIANSAAKHAAESDPTGARLSLDVARACPICDGALSNVRTALVSVDVCTLHGTWFDRDELGRLARNLEFERVSATPQAADGPATSPSADILLSILGRSNDA